MVNLKGKNILSLADLSKEEVYFILQEMKRLKKDPGKNKLLQDRIIGLIFEKPSTRTRVSFETSIFQLGGKAVYLRSDELQLKRGEPIKDTARVLSNYLDGLVIRTYKQETLELFSRYSSIPIINGLSDLGHPTQILSDLLTIWEVKNRLEDLKIAWIGDGNNVCNSWLLCCGLIGIDISAACPKGYEPDKKIIEKAKTFAGKTGVKIDVVNDPFKAVNNADILYTDVWVSMGQEGETETKEKAFEDYQINSELLTKAKEDASVMHCLPAHRGMEITEDVLEGKQSIVWKQAENKLHGARGILASIIP